MILILWILIFATSLFVLIKASGYFTKYSEKLGLHFGIPQFIVGITIVSIGTSLPELASSLVAVFKDSTEIVVGNVFGSNIANILLVVGVAAVATKAIKVKRNLINLDLPLLACLTAAIAIIAWDGKVTWLDGLILIVGYIIYAHYTYKSSKEQESQENQKDKPKEKFDPKIILWIILSAAFIYAGAEFTIRSVIEISDVLNVGVSIVAITAVAIGTSLPELFVSITAARKGNYEMSLGNIFGSCIFNGAIVLGFPALIKTLEVPEQLILIGLPFLIISTVLFVFSGISRRIHNWEGAMYLLIYLLFIGKLFNIL